MCVSYENLLQLNVEEEEEEKYLSKTESLFCLTGSELRKEGSKERCLPGAADNETDMQSHAESEGFPRLRLDVSPLFTGVGATSAAACPPPGQPELAISSRQRLRRGLSCCLGSGMREGGLLGEGETAAGGRGGVRGGLLGAGRDERDGGSTSGSTDDLLPRWKRGEQGGEPGWMTSPSEVERLLLAMELAVGFM